MTRPSQRLLLAVANVRLGLWLPNPVRCDPDEHTAQRHRGSWTWWRKLRAQWRQPGPRLLLAELAGRTHLDHRWLYITDGGHYDNLGLVEALRREPGTVLAFDASGDRVDRWSTLGQAIALARSELGVRVEIDPRQMEAIDDQHVHTPFVRGDIWYARPGPPDRPSGSSSAESSSRPIERWGIARPS
jgi:hypothetical protein